MIPEQLHCCVLLGGLGNPQGNVDLLPGSNSTRVGGWLVRGKNIYGSSDGVGKKTATEATSEAVEVEASAEAEGVRVRSGLAPGLEGHEVA